MILGEILADQYYAFLCFAALQSGLTVWIIFTLGPPAQRWYYPHRRWFSLALITVLAWSMCFVGFWCAATLVLISRLIH